jgi:hypothetical protein
VWPSGRSGCASTCARLDVGVLGRDDTRIRQTRGRPHVGALRAISVQALAGHGERPIRVTVDEHSCAALPGVGKTGDVEQRDEMVRRRNRSAEIGVVLKRGDVVRTFSQDRARGVVEAVSGRGMAVTAV